MILVEIKLNKVAQGIENQGALKNIAFLPRTIDLKYLYFFVVFALIGFVFNYWRVLHMRALHVKLPTTSQNQLFSCTIFLAFCLYQKVKPKKRPSQNMEETTHSILNPHALTFLHIFITYSVPAGGVALSWRG